MHAMRSTLFITALLCLLAGASSAQTNLPLHPALETAPTGTEDGSGGYATFTGPAGGPSLAWHNFRQHDAAGDIAPGLVFTWDLPLATVFEECSLTARPGLSYLHPTLLVDGLLRLQWQDHAAAIAGFSLDPTGTRETRFEDSTPEWMWIGERESIGQRSYAVFGLQIPTGFAYYEFLYRVQLEKGAHAYYVNSDRTIQFSTGYRRTFLLSLGMGIWL